MSAASDPSDPSDSARFLLTHFDRLAEAPGGIAKLRALVLQFAAQGKFVTQNPKDEPAEVTLKRSNKNAIILTEELAFTAPRGWCWTTLGSLIVSNLGGGTPSKNIHAYWDGLIPWASVKDVGKTKYLSQTQDSISEAGLKDSSSNLIPPGRLIVVTRMGLGKLSINTIAVAINQDLRALEIGDALVVDYLYDFFQTQKIEGSGMTVKGIKLAELMAMPVPLPPLSEQRRIVAKVEELMGLCDALEATQREREAVRTRLRTSALHQLASPDSASKSVGFIVKKFSAFITSPKDLDELRTTVRILAVQGKLVPQNPRDESVDDLLARVDSERRETATADRRADRGTQLLLSEDLRWDLPPSWRWRALGDLVLFIDYRGKTPNKVGSGIRLITAKNVRKGFINLLPEEFLSEHDYDAWMTRGLPEIGDVLFTTEAPMGNAAVVRLTERFGLAQRVINFRPYGGVDPDYMAFALLSEPFQAILGAEGTGMTAKGIKGAKLKRLPFPLPPLAEQRRIVAKVDELMAVLDALEAALTTARATAGNLLTATIAGLHAA